MTDFILKKFQMIQMVKEYLKYIISTKRNSERSLLQGELKKMEKYSLVNWKLEDVNGYNKFERIEYVDISLKPFKNFPSSMPQWWNKYKMSGIWWIITCNSCFTNGQIGDILCSFKNILKYINPETKDWFRDLFKYLKLVQSKKANYINIEFNS